MVARFVKVTQSLYEPERRGRVIEKGKINVQYSKMERIREREFDKIIMRKGYIG